MISAQIARMAKHYKLRLENGYGGYEEQFPSDQLLTPYYMAEGHLQWMCARIETFLQEGHTDKAERWIRFVQGALWMAGIETIEQIKKDNSEP